MRQVPAESLRRLKAFLIYMELSGEIGFYPHFIQLWIAMLLWEAKEASPREIIVPLPPSLLKDGVEKELCISFVLGKCKFDYSCRNSHNLSSPKPLCEDYFINGWCPFEGRCHYAHTTRERAPRIAAGSLQQRGDAVSQCWFSWEDHLFIKDCVLYFGPKASDNSSVERLLSKRGMRSGNQQFNNLAAPNFQSAGRQSFYAASRQGLPFPFTAGFFETHLLPFLDHGSRLALSAVCKCFRFLADKVEEEENRLLSLLPPRPSWRPRSPLQEKLQIRKALMWYGSVQAALPRLLRVQQPDPAIPLEVVVDGEKYEYSDPLKDALDFVSLAPVVSRGDEGSEDYVGYYCVDPAEVSLLATRLLPRVNGEVMKVLTAANQVHEGLIFISNVL